MKTVLWGKSDLRGIDALEWEIMLKFVFAFLLKKMVYFKTKELAPIGSKFVPSRVDLFRKGLGVQEIGNNQQTLSPLYKMVEDLPNLSS